MTLFIIYYIILLLSNRLDNILFLTARCPICMRKPMYEFNSCLNISSVRGDERRSAEGRQNEGDEAKLNWTSNTGGAMCRWRHVGRDVRKEWCPDSISSPPMGIPRMLQQCGNRLHPITPEALHPRSALVSQTDNLTELNLFKGSQGSWKVWTH